MDSAQLQALMMGKIGDMPNKARRVAEYLLANMREAAFRSIGEVGKLVVHPDSPPPLALAPAGGRSRGYRAV